TKSDQYSLALVYAELLTGSFPYPGQTSPQLILQHVTAAPDLSQLPPGDRPAVARALAKQPAQRFASCSEFARALSGTKESGTAVTIPTGPNPRRGEPLATTPRPGDTTLPPSVRSDVEQSPPPVGGEAGQAGSEARFPDGTPSSQRFDRSRRRI